MWDRWQRGESLSSIGRLFGRESSSVLVYYPKQAALGRHFEKDHVSH